MAGNFNNLMKQAQAMQANMQKAQAEIGNIEVIGEAGGGMVKVTMNGRHEVKRVQIEPAVSSEDREMLEDLIRSGGQRRRTQDRSARQEKMAEAATRRDCSCRPDEFAVLSAPSMMQHSPHLARLIEALRALPGVGPKSAQRMAFHLLQEGRPRARVLSVALEAALASVARCRRCRMLTEGELCTICAAPLRDATLLCAVESPADVVAVESSGSYRGRASCSWGICRRSMAWDLSWPRQPRARGNLAEGTGMN